MPHSPSTSPSRIFSEARDIALRMAAKDSSVPAETYALGPYEISFRISHPGMNKFLEAFRHLPRPGSVGKRLTVYLWDSAHSGKNFPFLPLHDREENGKTQRYLLERNGFRFLYNFFEGNFSCLAIDFRHDEAVFWTKDHAEPFHADCAAPLFPLLTWWLRRQDLFFAHAGAVGKEGRGVLVAGPGGSGKTSICLSALGSGMDFLGDDHILLEDDKSITAYSLYNCVKLAPVPAFRKSCFR